jgi:hypothetical protein
LSFLIPPKQHPIFFFPFQISFHTFTVCREIENILKEIINKNLEDNRPIRIEASENTFLKRDNKIN